MKKENLLEVNILDGYLACEEDLTTITLTKS